jgi:hypothetical protein
MRFSYVINRRSFGLGFDLDLYLRLFDVKIGPLHLMLDY